MSFEIISKDNSVQDVIELYGSCGIGAIDVDRSKLSTLLKGIEEFRGLRMYSFLTFQERDALFIIQDVSERFCSILASVNEIKVKEDACYRDQLKMHSVAVAEALDELLPKPSGNKFEALDFAVLLFSLKSAKIILNHVSREELSSDTQEKFDRCYRLGLGVNSFSINIYYDMRHWLTELLKTRIRTNARACLVSFMELAKIERCEVMSDYANLLEYIQRTIINRSG